MYSTQKILVFLLLTYSCISLVVTQTNATSFMRTQSDINLEKTRNCSCVFYVHCQEINRYTVQRVTRSALLPPPPSCSNSNYVCCRAADEDLEGPTILLREPDTQNCGDARLPLTPRFGDSDEDSSATIPGEFPWLVEIFQKTKYGKPPYTLKCLGSLIHPKVILTTTHCIKSSTEAALKIVATGREVFQNVGVNEANERNVEKIIKHPQYYSGGFHNNIALLILTEQYKYGEYPINSVCLPSPNQVFTGKTCSVAGGWGQNRNLSALPLRKVNLPVIDPEECQNLLRKVKKSSTFNLHPSSLCAGGEERKDTCKGDGGSPLACLRDDYKFVQVGITSWGFGCGIVNQPGVYTDVAKFKEWIIEEIAQYDLKL